MTDYFQDVGGVWVDNQIDGMAPGAETLLGQKRPLERKQRDAAKLTSVEKFSREILRGAQDDNCRKQKSRERLLSALVVK